MKAQEFRERETPQVPTFDVDYARILKQRSPRTEKDELLLELYEQLQEKHSAAAPDAEG